MDWKIILKKLERAKNWDVAIEFMEQVVKDNPEDVEVYIFIQYLLMNLLVEEFYDDSKHDYYALLTKKYFDEGYAKFYNNAEYLYYTAKTAVMSEWYFDIEREDYEKMFEKALQFDPNNLLYQDCYYINLDTSIVENKQAVTAYAKKFTSKDSPIKQILVSKGAIGEYILEIMTCHWKETISGA